MAHIQCTGILTKKGRALPEPGQMNLLKDYLVLSFRFPLFFHEFPYLPLLPLLTEKPASEDEYP
jgi:hypothetical protein